MFKFEMGQQVHYRDAEKDTWVTGPVIARGQFKDFEENRYLVGIAEDQAYAANESELRSDTDIKTEQQAKEDLES